MRSLLGFYEPVAVLFMICPVTYSVVVFDRFGRYCRLFDHVNGKQRTVFSDYSAFRSIVACILPIVVCLLFLLVSLVGYLVIVKLPI